MSVRSDYSFQLARAVRLVDESDLEDVVCAETHVSTYFRE